MAKRDISLDLFNHGNALRAKFSMEKLQDDPELLEILSQIPDVERSSTDPDNMSVNQLPAP